MALRIVRNDITKMQVDVIVNTANEAPMYSTGLDSAVYRGAGEEVLLAERKKIGWMQEGQVAITPGFNLPAKYIIHAVSPCYIDGTYGEEELLRDCYSGSLALACEHDCKSIAFPLISTGNFGYPKDEAMRIALDEINAFLMAQDMLVYLVLFDSESTKLGQNLYPDLQAYIDNNYVADKQVEEYGDVCAQIEEYCIKNAPRMASVSRCMSVQAFDDDECCKEALGGSCIDNLDDLSTEEYYEFVDEKETALEERMKHLSDTFQEYLFYLIKVKGYTNVDVYKRAYIDKRQFSKIKNNPDYHPDKFTALRLCVGAMLNLDEAKDLLARAGYALAPCDKRDVIFSYFFEKHVYDMSEISITLEDNGIVCDFNS